MREFLEIENFIRISLGLVAFTIIVTLAVMQAVKPYLQSVVYKASLRTLLADTDEERLLEILRTKALQEYIGGAYPSIANRFWDHVSHLPLRDEPIWEDVSRLHLQDEPFSVVKEAATPGVGVDILMRVVQNAARALIERPIDDIRSYAALTKQAEPRDRLAGLALDAIRRGDPRAFSGSGDQGEQVPRWDEPERRPSELALAAVAVRENLATAVERTLDATQVSIIGWWRITGQLCAVAIGISTAIFVGAAADVLSAEGLLWAGAALILIPVAYLHLLTRRRWGAGSPFGSGNSLRSRRGRGVLVLALPILAFFTWLVVIRLAAGEHIYSLAVIGAVSGLVASMVYDTAKGWARRR